MNKLKDVSFSHVSVFKEAINYTYSQLVASFSNASEI